MMLLRRLMRLVGSSGAIRLMGNLGAIRVVATLVVALTSTAQRLGASRMQDAAARLVVQAAAAQSTILFRCLRRCCP